MSEHVIKSYTPVEVEMRTRAIGLRQAYGDEIQRLTRLNEALAKKGEGIHRPDEAIARNEQRIETLLEACGPFIDKALEKAHIVSYPNVYAEAKWDHLLSASIRAAIIPAEKLRLATGPRAKRLVHQTNVACPNFSWGLIIDTTSWRPTLLTGPSDQMHTGLYEIAEQTLGQEVHDIISCYVVDNGEISIIQLNNPDRLCPFWINRGKSKEAILSVGVLKNGYTTNKEYEVLGSNCRPILKLVNAGGNSDESR